MNELSLFSGIGCGLLGTKILGYSLVGCVEINPRRCKILKARMDDETYNQAPIWNMDIREFNRRVAERYRGMVDLITAGPPCQPFSRGGKMYGEKDNRDRLSDTVETIRLVRPQEVLLENVPDLLIFGGYIGQFFGALAEIGYDLRWDCISAAICGANHLRKRLWLVANPHKTGWNPENLTKKRQVAGCSWWTAEPGICRVDDGSPGGIQRREALGEGQVPVVVREAYRLLSGK